MTASVVPTPAVAAAPLRERVAHERTRLRLLTTAAGAGVAVALAAVLLALAALLLDDGRWITLPAALPLVAWLVVLSCAGAIALGTRRVVHRTLGERDVAAAIEREQGLRDGAVRGALEVAGGGALARRAEQRVAASLRPGGALAPAWRRRAARWATAAGGGAALAALLLAAVASSARDGWAAVAHPLRAWAGTLLPDLAVVDAPAGVLRGEPLTLAVSAPGRREVTIRLRATGGAWRSVRVPVVNERAALALASVDADLTVLASDGRATSDTAHVAVTDRPFLGDVSVRATFPAYLRRPAETLPLGEPMRVPRGTELRVEGASSTLLRSVALAAGADTLQLVVEGRRFAGVLHAERSVRWTWSAAGASGLTPDLPAPLELDVVPDLAPTVEIRAPSRDTVVLPTGTATIRLAAADDHGLGDVVLRSWRRRADGGSDAEATLRVAPGGAASWSGAATLDLGSRGLRPGDELHVVASAVDLSPWRRSGESRVLVLRVPTMSDQRANVRAAADSAVARALSAAGAQRALAQRTADASRMRERGSAARQSGESGGGGSGGDGMSYESAERARALASEQRQLAQDVEQMRDAARELERQLQQAGALDPELQERLREAQRLMQEAMTPELQEQLRRLEQAAGQLSQEQTRQSLADLARQQQQMREQLERSAEMLRRAALEGAMETLRDEAAELAEEQRKLADSPSAGTPAQRDASARQQPAPSEQELARRAEQLARDVQRLQERLQEQKATAGAERAQDAAEHSERSAAAMREAARERARGERQEASPQQGAQTGDPRRQAGTQQQSGSQQGGQQQSGQQQGGQQQGGQQQGGQQQGGQQQGAQAGGQRAGGQQSAGQQGGGQQGAGQQGRQQPGGQQSGGEQAGGRQGDRSSDAARQAAAEMQQAADQLAQARSEQVNEWKQELTSELDRSINELMQLAREQSEIEQQARQGASPEELRAQQGAVQQGVQRTGQRLDEAGKSTSLLSQRSQQAVAQAEQQVAQATRQAQQAQGGAGQPGAQQAAAAMRQASEALNQAAASLVRDRARANASQSATGFAEMMQEMQRLAQQQGAISSQAAGLMPGAAGRQGNAEAAAQARQLAQQQREIARRLDELADRDGTGRTDALADEARRLAQALQGGAPDASTVNRQQRLFRRMLDAGRTLEQDERDDTGKREGESARTGDRFTPPSLDGAARDARRFALPEWNELRGLSPEERRLVIEYFRRLNGDTGPAPPAPTPPPER